MYRIKVLVTLLITMIISAQSVGQKLDNAAIQRIGDYGKIWSAVNLFHPSMAYNVINADSLYTDNIGELIKDPTAANFKYAVQKLLHKLNDLSTSIVELSVNENDSVNLPQRSLLTWLPDSIALLHFDENFMSLNNNSFGKNIASKQLKDSLKNAKGIIIDLRKTKNNDAVSDYYETIFLNSLVSFIIDHDISYIPSRSRIHYGHESQTFDMSSFYYQGWMTINPTFIRKAPNSVNKPVCLLVNRFNKNIGEAIIAVQKAGVAKVVSVDSLKGFSSTAHYIMEVADGVKVNLNLGESVFENGCKDFVPDVIVKSTVADIENSLLTASKELLTQKWQDKIICPQIANDILPAKMVETYDGMNYPSAPLRLLGLMRYWSAINYFCPNKALIKKNWDSVLNEYVPKFLSGRDSTEYIDVVARLITEIHDGHGWLDSKVWTILHRNIPEIKLKFVENKTIVFKTYNDSIRKVMSPGDEILKINDVPINEVRKNFAQIIGASNDAALQRVVTLNVLSGPENSNVRITYLHNGEVKNIIRPRTAKRYAFNNETGLPGQTKPWKKINEKTGYVDFGKIEVDQVDSMMNDFKNLDAIILDNRSYPRGTAWTLVNYLTSKKVITAKGTTMIATSPDPATTTTQSSLWEIPVTSKMIYKGKIIILVNEETQSQAEYSCMVIQAAHKNTTIIGSQTAGADGDVTGIVFPGDIQTAFSGHGIFYPDGRATQGIGIIPDIKIAPSIKGIKGGKDEVLERAIQFAKTGK
ncbi:MAG: S41 family peptidase [Ginsengibacter sp.]